MIKRDYFNDTDAGIGSVLFMALQAVILALLTALIKAGIPYDGVFSIIANALVEGAFVLTVVILAYSAGAKFTKVTGMTKKPTGMQIFLCLIIAAVSLYGFANLTNLFYYGIQSTGYESVVSDIQINSIGRVLLYTLTICVIPAFCEEILFRGLILNGLKSSMTKWGAIILSALLFMLMHGNPDQTIYQFILGIILGYIMYETGNIWLSIIVHFLNNFYVVIMNYIASLGTTASETIESENLMPVGGEWVVLIISALVFAGLAVLFLYFLLKAIKSTQKQQSQFEGELKVDAKIDNQNVETTLSDLSSQVNKKPRRLSRAALIWLTISLTWMMFEWISTFVTGLLK